MHFVLPCQHRHLGFGLKVWLHVRLFLRTCNSRTVANLISTLPLQVRYKANKLPKYINNIYTLF